jgi:hypothetical protein
MTALTAASASQIPFEPSLPLSIASTSKAQRGEVGVSMERERSGIEDAGEDPDRWLLIGPDTAGNLLEVVVLISVEDTQIVIHAMPMRDKYARLLEP